MSIGNPDHSPGELEVSTDEYWSGGRVAASQLEAASGGELEWLGGFGGFVLAVVFVVASAVMIAVGSQELREARIWVDHTNSVLLATGDVREALLAADVARRDYIITGDGIYLSGYTRQKASASKGLDKLAALVSDNPAQEARVAALRGLVSNVWERADAEIKSSTPAEIAQAMRNDRARANDLQISNALTAQFDRLRSVEMNLLTVRERDTDSAQGWFLTFAALSILLSLGAVAIGVFLMQRQIAAARARELQSEQMHIERLGLMNQTSAVLAHEIKQPLMAALNYFRAFLRMTENGNADGAKTREIAEKIEKQILRAADIVARLRIFIDRDEGERRLESPQTLIADAVDLFGAMDSSVKLETRIVPDLPHVLVDRIQAQQVLVNLMRNAVEALEGRENQRLLLSASLCGTGEVEFCLEDNGKGLLQESTRRLFGSLVAPKKDGMELGLSICRSIIADHGGRIWASPSGEGGAAIHFTFPIGAEA